ncbi:MAG: DUF167 family protein [Sphingomonas sp.]
MDGVMLAVRLTPRAAKDAVGGLVADATGRPALMVRVTAPPVDGGANAALTTLLARTLGVRTGDVRMQSGDTARLKRLSIRGDAQRLAERLDALIVSSSA